MKDKYKLLVFILAGSNITGIVLGHGEFAKKVEGLNTEQRVFLAMIL